MDSETILQFKNVDFRYTPESGLSLQGINFTLKRQTVLGIIGPTGSGKTTLTQLIPRFMMLVKALCYLMNKTFVTGPRDTHEVKFRKVPQTAVLFTGTIRENPSVGKT